MKCIKNTKTGEIIRIEDKSAYQTVGVSWQYVPKSEWKAATRVVSEKQEVEAEKKERTLSKKAEKAAKLKAKQRQ